MVASDTSGNISRPPYRSVSAPTGMRPSDPTTTGTATTSACWTGVRCRTSLNFGPSGLSSAQAQKFTANPTVARPSIRPGRAAPGGTVRGVRAAPVVSGLLILGSALSPHRPGWHADAGRHPGHMFTMAPGTDAPVGTLAPLLTALRP